MSNQIQLYISLFAAAVSLLALAFTVLTYYMGLRRQRKQATLDAYNTLQKEALDKLNTYTKKQIAEISENPRSEEYKELSALLARCEHFAVGVNSRIYDAGTLRRLANVFFAGLYDKLTPLIEKKRKISTAAKHYAEQEELSAEQQPGINAAVILFQKTETPDAPCPYLGSLRRNQLGEQVIALAVVCSSLNAIASISSCREPGLRYPP